MRVITFSRHFPSYHPRKGEPTHFVEKIWKYYRQEDSNLPAIFRPYWKKYIDIFKEQPYLKANYIDTPKLHTIRAGHRWSAGDWFSPRVWSGTPRRSKQIEFAPPIQVVRTYEFGINFGEWLLEGKEISLELLITIARNDGLALQDFIDWFKWPKAFDGQVIAWSDKINYV